MARVKESVWLWVCERCGYKWLPRDADMEPKRCPGCKSPYWNRPRQSNKGKARKTGSWGMVAVVLEYTRIPHRRRWC